MLDGGPGADDLGGGGGQDTVSFASRTVGVVARIGSAGDGEEGEGDVIAGDVENLMGGSGDDVLIGSDGPNRLDGGTGADRLEGLGDRDLLYGGDGSPPSPSDHDPDVLHGGDGPDVIQVRAGATAFGDGGDDEIDVWESGVADGGAGADWIRTWGTGGSVLARDGARDHVECDAGLPALVRLDRADLSLRCGGGVRRRVPGIAGVWRLATRFEPPSWPRAAGFAIACPDDAGRRCAAHLALRWDGRFIARRQMTLRHSQDREVWLPLPPDARSAMRRAGQLQLALAVTMRDRRGALRTDVATSCLRPGEEPLPSC